MLVCCVCKWVLHKSCVCVYNSLTQEKLLLSIFPKEVASTIQSDLKGSLLTFEQSESLFRKLYVNRFDNVR